jgi:hypothetical protein
LARARSAGEVAGRLDRVALVEGGGAVDADSVVGAELEAALVVAGAAAVVAGALVVDGVPPVSAVQAALTHHAAHRTAARARRMRPSSQAR